jgi:alanine racemase
MVRPGLGVYGYWGGPMNERPEDLRPIMRVVAAIDQVRRVPAGTSVGYGSSWRAPRDSVIGVLPIGYADGYRRAHGNDAVVTVTGQNGKPRSVPVVGRVSMDQTTIDLTDVPGIQPGDEVIVIDNDPAAANSVEALAEKLDTIPYEMSTLIGPRVTRVAVD